MQLLDGGSVAYAVMQCLGKASVVMIDAPAPIYAHDAEIFHDHDVLFARASQADLISGVRGEVLCAQLSWDLIAIVAFKLQHEPQRPVF